MLGMPGRRAKLETYEKLGLGGTLALVGLEKRHTRDSNYIDESRPHTGYIVGRLRSNKQCGLILIFRYAVCATRWVLMSAGACESCHAVLFLSLPSDGRICRRRRTCTSHTGRPYDDGRRVRCPIYVSGEIPEVCLVARRQLDVGMLGVGNRLRASCYGPGWHRNAAWLVVCTGSLAERACCKPVCCGRGP